MEQKEREIKASSRLDINLSLLAVCFTVFALIISLEPALFSENFLVPMQLTVAIPLLLSSIFARAKFAYTKKPGIWNKYGLVTFLIAYSFLINTVGILLSKVIGTPYGLTFLISNIVISLVYSIFEILEDGNKIVPELGKDFIFISILFFGGILPSLGAY
jgi:hypothetical protein